MPLIVERCGQQQADLVEIRHLALAVEVIVGVPHEAVVQLTDQLLVAVLQGAVGRAYLALLHIILCPGMGIPLFVDLGVSLERERGAGIGAQRVAGVELDPGGHEVEGLGNGQPNSFIASRIIDTGGDADREPVGVADAIQASEATVAEQAVVVLAHGGGVVDPDVVLILVGHIEVLELRLQSLAGPFPEPLLVALEGHAALEAERGQHPGDDALFQGDVTPALGRESVGEGTAHVIRHRLIVTGVHQLVLAVEEVTRLVNEGDGQGGGRVDPGAGVGATLVLLDGLVVVVAEVGQLGVPGQIVPAALLVVVVVDARHQLVGLLGAGQQNLVGPHLGIEVPVLLEVAGREGLLQLVVDLGPHLGGEVVEVVVVPIPHLGVVHRHSQGVVHEHGGVAGVEQIAMPVGQVVVEAVRLVVLLVIRQVFEIEAAHVGRIRHVAELDLLHQAPSVHETGGDGGIVVGRYVPVKRLGDVHAVLGALGIARVEQARLALILDGEVDIGEIEDRIVIEPEAGVPGFPEHLGLIDVYAAGFQGPGFLTRGTGSVLGALQGDVLVVVGHGDFLGKAAHR